MCPDENINILLSQNKPLAEADARMFSPITLAFVGDAVYSLLVREMLTVKANKPTGKLHRESVAYENAAFQAKMIKAILPLLTPEETDVFKRGRNAQNTHRPKNQSKIDYRYATGLEAVFGYLYLCGKQQRMSTLFNEIITLSEQNTEPSPADSR